MKNSHSKQNAAFRTKWAATSESLKAARMLTKAERQKLEALETEIAKNIDHEERQYLVACRLWEIDQDRLFREEHPTIEDYVRRRWNVGYESYRRKVRWIDAERVLAHGPELSDDARPPETPILNARQARPLEQLLSKRQYRHVAAVVEAAKKRAEAEKKSFSHHHVADATDETLAALARDERQVALAGAEASKALPLADRFLTGDSRFAKNLLPRKANVVVTSLPFNVGHRYGDGYDDDLPYDQFVALMNDLLNGIVEAVETFGRICINVADTGTGSEAEPFDAIRPLDVMVMEAMRRLGCALLARHVWNRKKASKRMSHYYGSHGSPSHPKPVRQHEHVLVFGKGGSKRPDVDRHRSLCRNGQKWDTYIRSVWEFHPVGHKIGGHPCPFPVELPHRCLSLYAARGDVVLDPCGGIGSTAIAAHRLGLEFFSIDLFEQWTVVARQRFYREIKRSKKNRRPGAD